MLNPVLEASGVFKRDFFKEEVVNEAEKYALSSAADRCTDPTQNPCAAGQNHAGTLAEGTVSLTSAAVSLACPAVAHAARSQGRFDAQV